jgi:hypothetical protein
LQSGGQKQVKNWKGPKKRVSKWLGPSGITGIDVSFPALLQSGDEAVV